MSAEFYTLLDSKLLFDQFQRLMFLKYFPKKLDEVASYRQEFNRVMSRCKSDAMAMMVVTDWIDNNTDRPTFSELAQVISRHIVNSNEADRGSQKREDKCQVCYGDGYVSIPLMVTYHTDSGYEIKSLEPMTDVDWPKAEDFRKKLGKNQDIIGGTVKCLCSPEDQEKCKKCNGFGYHSGRLAGRRAAPWSWCDCTWAEFARSSSPETVNEANAARNILLAKFDSIPASVQSKL